MVVAATASVKVDADLSVDVKRSGSKVKVKVKASAKAYVRVPKFPSGTRKVKLGSISKSQTETFEIKSSKYTRTEKTGPFSITYEISKKKVCVKASAKWKGKSFSTPKVCKSI